MLDRIGLLIETRFATRPNDLPLLSLSRNIGIELRELLGETSLPLAIEPLGDVLI